MLTFTGKTAIVTGGGGGIGLQIVKDLLNQKIDVFAVDIKSKPTCKELGPSANSLHYTQGDICDASVVDDVLDQVKVNSGKLDYLVLAAGIFPTNDGPITDLPQEIFDHVFKVNFQSAVQFVQKSKPLFLTSTFASIVFVASIVGLRNMENIASGGACDAYQISKSAIVSLSRSLAISLATQNIRSNTICPGAVHTPMTERIYQDPSRIKEMHERTPLGRIGHPEDIAAACLYLLSDQASFVTGTDLIVDGGLMAKL